MKRLFPQLILLHFFAMFFCACSKSDDVIEDTPIISVTHEAVDLGLSVKWASYNVGATSPEEYGDYYAWGETKSKATYDWSSYKWGQGTSLTMTKYCLLSDYGTVDKKKTLSLDDDVAHVNWGGSWRMPTVEEQVELCKNCTWIWTTLNGVNGIKVSSKVNGKSIFLPAAGCYNSSGLVDVGTTGCYWSKSLDSESSDDAYYQYFISDFVGRYYDNDRCIGQSVRPVCP